MTRDDKIENLSNGIQTRLNKLKKLNCRIDTMGNNIFIFDDNIPPKEVFDAGSCVDDYTGAVVFSFTK